MEYKRLERSDGEKLIPLYCATLTGGESVEKELQEGLDSGELEGFLALEDGEILGFMLYKPGINLTYPHPDVEQEILQNSVGRDLYSIEGIYVRKESRHRGIASTLADMVDRDIAEKHGMIVFEQWVYPDGTSPVQSISDDWGTPVYEKMIPGFYKENDKYGLICAYCGKYCNCGARVGLYDTF